MESRKISLLIIDRCAVVRRGLGEILRNDPSIFVAGEAETITEGMALAERLNPDVILMDVGTPYNDSYHAVSILRERLGIISLAFTDREDWGAVKRFLECGGAGYLTKSASETEIISAVKCIQAGGTYISPLLRQLPENSADKEPAALSKRECEVMTLVALGYTGAEIADQLCISPKTVETHRARITRKLGLNSRVQLVRYAFDHGLLTFGPKDNVE